MSQQLLLGVAAIALAGVLQGSFAAPMKRMTAWRWENSWLVYAVAGLIVFPWITNFATVPAVIGVYSGASASTLIKVFLFGLLWGVGSALFGLGISRVGMGLGFALILGITASFGSLLPLLVLHPEQLTAKRGLALIEGTVVMLIGVGFLAVAGTVRERDLGNGAKARSGFVAGLVLCIFSGIFSAMLNFSFVFGDELRQRALQSGASNAMATNPIWALTVTGGFISNFVYCAYLLNRNGAWSKFREGVRSPYWLLGSSMGLLWFGGIVLYGIGSASLGTLGGVVGWPIFMAVIIITAIGWGAASGEWRGASRRARTCNWTGVAILLLAIAVISAGNV
jgi:L-rhamnose-H+ transport protein